MTNTVTLEKANRFIGSLFLFIIFLVVSAGAQQITPKASTSSIRYSADPIVESGVLSSAIILQVWSQMRFRSMEIPENPKFSELPWDKPFTGTYNPTAATISDVLLWVPLIVPATGAYDLYKDRQSSTDYWTEWMILSEVIAINSGLNILCRSGQFWARPMLANKNIPEKAKKDPEISTSFYSGHASGAFSTATAAWLLYSARSHQPVDKWVMAAILYGGATTVSALRVAAGKHYPTDVITGAIIGSFIGWLVPKLHEEKVEDGSSQVALGAGSRGPGLFFRFTF